MQPTDREDKSRTTRWKSAALALTAVIIVAVVAYLAVSLTNTRPMSLREGKLDGTTWRLVRLNGHPAVIGTRVTLEFSESGFSAFTGCNYYSGRYSEDSQSFGFIMTTLLLCFGGVGEQDAEFYEVIQEVVRYEVNGLRLKLYDGQDTLRIVFSRSILP